MTIRFAIPNSGITLVAEDSPDYRAELRDLVSQYEQLGGSKVFFEGHVRRAIARMEAAALSPGVATAVEHLNAHVDRVEEIDEHGQETIVDDPWAAGPDERVTTPVRPAYKPGGKTSQPTATPQQGDPAAFLGTDSQGWGQKFYRDQRAPQCECGVQAIRKAATSQNGKAYQAYVCFDAGPKDAGADYRNKCSFSELVPRGR